MVCSLVSIYFNSPQLGIQTDCNTLNYWSRDLLNFGVLKMDLEIVSPPHFLYDFSRKMFLVLYSFNWPKFIAWLRFFLEILVNICIAIVYFSNCDFTNFETNLIFQIKPFFYKTKNEEKFNYLEEKI